MFTEGRVGTAADWSGAGRAWRAKPQAEKAALQKRTRDSKRQSMALRRKGSIFGEKASRRVARLKKAAISARLGNVVAEADAEPEPFLALSEKVDHQQLPMSTLDELHKVAKQIDRKTHGKRPATFQID